MIVMPANNTNAHKLEAEHPGRMGLLMSPGGCRSPRALPYVIDNGMYSAFVKSGYETCMLAQRKHWDHDNWRKAIEWSLSLDNRPQWAVVPDVVGNASDTRAQFDLWLPAFTERGLQPAIAVQDGMTPDDVPDGVVCFLGGTTEWKWSHLELFCRDCPHVHVGRVNQYRRLWQCHEAGAESVDGTGFFRGDQKQLRGLLAYLRESDIGDVQPRKQMKLTNGE